MEEYDGKEQASYWVYHGQSPYGRGEDCEVRKTQEGQYGAWRARGGRDGHVPGDVDWG